MIIKICGIRTADDALAATEAGADMLGFNFHPPSPRYLKPLDCRQLVQVLRRAVLRPPVLVGVFVNIPSSEVANVLELCGLDLAQLHGDEPPEVLDALAGRAFKAIRPRSPEAAAAEACAHRRPISRGPEILLDASAPDLYGGSGRIANWSLAASLAAETRLMLAGGLYAGNVAEAVTVVRPWGLDVASGVESAPGVKDASRVRVFIERARAAAEECAEPNERQVRCEPVQARVSQQARDKR